MDRLIVTAMLFLVISSAPAAGGSMRPTGAISAPPDDVVAHGGRLYDKWWGELGQPAPTATHPAYPATGKKSGATTWRCKECHGWDYRGNKGAYRQGSHATGIRGIDGAVGQPPEAIMATLTDATHRYGTLLPLAAQRSLAEFVARGQVDMTPYIDAEGTLVGRYSLERGKALFDDNCARCHGEDGRYQNFSHDPADPEYVGTVASKNPWEAWHKIRNGHPGSRMPMGPQMMGRWRHNEAMPPFHSYPIDDQLTILRYTQTLPVR